MSVREDWIDGGSVTYDVRERPTGSAHALADPDSLPPRLRRRRAYTLVGMTYLLPGAAQIVAGNRRLGRFGLCVWFLALTAAVVGALLAILRRGWLLTLLSRSWVLTALAAFAVLLAVVWLAAFVDAARLARIRRLPAATRQGVVVLTVLGMTLTACPLGWAASALYTGGSVLGTVFHSGVSAPPSKGRYNILLLGSDSGAGRVGTRPDTIMLASIDADTGRTVTFGFARDTENINFRPGSTMARLMPQGWNCGDECLLNGLYTWATEHKDQFPADVTDPGVQATREAVEALSGLDIQYYALIDLVGFRDLINAVGGLDIIVAKRTPIGGGSAPVHGYIEPGVQHLDGYHALWYARSREGSSNYERMARQKCVMEAAARQLDPQSVVLHFKDLAAASKGLLRTDVPQSDLGGLVELALRSRATPMTSVNFVPPLINPWDYHLDVIHQTVEKTIAGSEAATTTRRPRASASASASATTRAPTSDPAAPSMGPATSPAGTANGPDVCEIP